MSSDEDVRLRARIRRIMLIAAYGCSRVGLTGSAAARFIDEFTASCILDDDDRIIRRLRERLRVSRTPEATILSGPKIKFQACKTSHHLEFEVSIVLSNRARGSH